MIYLEAREKKSGKWIKKADVGISYSQYLDGLRFEDDLNLTSMEGRVYVVPRKDANFLLDTYVNGYRELDGRGTEKSDIILIQWPLSELAGGSNTTPRLIYNMLQHYRVE